MYSCYILRCADGSLYVGVAEDPLRRCREHNQGKGDGSFSERSQNNGVFIDEFQGWRLDSRER